MVKCTLVLLAIATAAALGAGCSDDPKRPPVAEGATGPGVAGGTGGAGSDGGAADAGADAGGDGDGGDGGAACTALQNVGPIIDQNAVNDVLPAGSGGTVSDGLYVVTDARVYQGAGGLPGPTGASYQGTMRIAGTAFERVLVLRSSAGASTESRVSGTFTPSGTNATIALTCPTTAQEQVTYTATADTIILSNLGTNETFTYTKQQ